MTSEADAFIKGKPTPGPWEVGYYKGIPTVFDSAGNGTFALATVHDLTAGDSDANAKLMAAAPAMLAALVKAFKELNTIRARDGVPWTHNCVKSSVCPEYFSSVVDEIDEAVREATGESAHCHWALYRGS